MRAAMVSGTTAAGAVLAAIVVAISHFTSKVSFGQYPYYYGSYSPDGSADPGVPTVHDSWWPVLPLGIAAGLVLGLLLGLSLMALGVRINRTPAVDALAS